MIDSCSVYFCEVVKVVLGFNVVVMIFVYNYLFGVLEFSVVDWRIIEQLKNVLVLLDVWVFDYFVVGDYVVIFFVE